MSVCAELDVAKAAAATSGGAVPRGLLPIAAARSGCAAAISVPSGSPSSRPSWRSQEVMFEILITFFSCAHYRLIPFYQMWDGLIWKTKYGLAVIQTFFFCIGYESSPLFFISTSVIVLIY